MLIDRPRVNRIRAATWTLRRTQAQSQGQLQLVGITCLVLILVLFAAPHTAGAQLLIDTIAGGSIGDGATADLAKFNPGDVVYDSAGNAYVADSSGNRIRRIDGATNVVTTIAGTGVGGFSGDGGPATQAQLFYPSNLVLDGNNNIFFSDQLNHRVRRIDAGSKVITTVAGNGTTSNLNDNGLAVEASLFFPAGVAIRADGSLLIADSGHNRIRRVAQGFITTVAGTGAGGYNGDDIPATAATLTGPNDVVADGQGNFYISDGGNCRIRLVQAGTDRIYTIAGNGTCGFTGNGGPATEARLNGPLFLALVNGSIYMTESLAPRIRRIDLGSNVISAFAGNGQLGTTGDGGAATAARLGNPLGLGGTPEGSIVFGEDDSGRLREVTNGIITSIAGQANGDGFSPQLAKINPKGIVCNLQGELFIADSNNNRLRRINASFGQITTFAGTGAFGFGGDNGPATQATLGGPLGVAIDSNGRVYFSDQLTHRIRRIAGGVVTTVAGTGTPSFSGDDGPAISAGLSFPAGIAVGPDDSVYVADASNNRVRRIGTNGIITTVIGNGSRGYNGENVPGKQAMLSNPTDVVADTDGNLYIADRNNCRIRRYDAETTLVTTVAGTGRCGYSGDNGQGTAAELNGPEYVALLENRHLYISESFTPRVRRVDLFTGIITRVAGNGLPASTGDGGPGLNAQLEMPAGLEVDRNNSVLYISDVAAGRVRRLQIETVPPSTFTPTRTRTFTPTFTATVTPTRTFTATFTPSNTPTVTNTFTATVTHTPTATITRTFTPTVTFSPSVTPTPTDTATASPSPSPSITRTATRTPTPSFTPTNTSSPTPTITLTRTPSFTGTATLTRTPTATFSPTLTFTPSFTATITSTRTFTPSPLPTNTPTVTPIPTNTSPPTFTRTMTPSATASRTATASPPPTNTATITATVTLTRTFTITSTPQPTFTATPSRTVTRSATVTFTPTRTGSPTVTRTATRTAAAATQTVARASTPTSTIPTATRTGTVTFTRTSTRTVTSTATAVPPTATRTVTPTRSGTKPPTATPPPGGTFTFTPRPTSTRPPTATVTLTVTSTRTRTSAPTSTPTLTRTFTRTPTISPTVTPRFSLSPTSAATATVTRTGTPGGTFTATITQTPSVTPRPEISETPTIGTAATATSTPIRSSTRTATATASASRTTTFTVTPAATLTRTSTAQPPPTRTVTRTPSSTRTPSLPPTKTVTRTASPTVTSNIAVGTATPTPNVRPTVTRSPDNGCTGDCNADNVVTSTEVNTVLTRVTLCGGAPGGPCLNVGACIRADTNRDGAISAAELTRTVENANEGCPGSN